MLRRFHKIYFSVLQLIYISHFLIIYSGLLEITTFLRQPLYIALVRVCSKSLKYHLTDSDCLRLDVSSWKGDPDYISIWMGLSSLSNGRMTCLKLVYQVSLLLTVYNLFFLRELELSIIASSMKPLLLMHAQQQITVAPLNLT